MTLKEKELALLVDLSKLLARHGASAFQELAKQLRAPNFGEELALVLNQVASAEKTPRRQQERKKQSSAERRARFRRDLVEFRASTPEKGRAVLSLYDALEDPSSRPSLMTLQAFLSDRDLPGAIASSRDTTVRQFVKYCKGLPTTEVEQYLDVFVGKSETEGGGLQEWGQVILGDD